MAKDYAKFKSYLDERVRHYPFISAMVGLYKGLIDIWCDSSPDDLSILFPSPREGEGGKMFPLLDTAGINDVNFTNSTATAMKVFSLFESMKKGADIECAGASSEAVLEFIREGISKDDRYRNAVLKWILKPSFEYTISKLSKMGNDLTLHPGGGGIGLGRRCPLCAAPPGMAIVYTQGYEHHPSPLPSPLRGEGKGEGVTTGSPGETAEQRLLSCCFCGYRWPYPITGCPSCGNERPERFGFIVGDSARDQCVRAVSCEECKTYIKTVFISCRSDKKMPADLDMDIEDVATLNLDILADQRGFAALCHR